MARIGFVTCANLERFFPAKQDDRYTHDDWPAVLALRERGYRVDPVVWGTPVDELKAFQLLVVRSPWDYMDSTANCANLMKWFSELKAAGIRVANPITTMLWNLDKRYLDDMRRAGIPIVETEFIGADVTLDETDLTARFRERGPFVIKPCHSAGARDTFLIDREPVEDCLQEKNGVVSGSFDAWRNGRPFMLQPFLTSVVEEGEWSLIYLGGKYSHAVRKRPPAGGWLVQDELGGTLEWASPPTEVRDLGDASIAALSAAVPEASEVPLLYTRVDILRDQTGLPVLGELELVEPELFFLSRPPLAIEPFRPAIDQFCDALAMMLG